MFCMGLLKRAGFVVLKTRDLRPEVQICACTVPTHPPRSSGPRARACSRATARCSSTCAPSSSRTRATRVGSFAPRGAPCLPALAREDRRRCLAQVPALVVVPALAPRQRPAHRRRAHRRRHWAAAEIQGPQRAQPKGRPARLARRLEAATCAASRTIGCRPASCPCQGMTSR